MSDPFSAPVWLLLPPKAGKGGANESRPQFEAFQRYCDLTPQRSLRRLSETIAKPEKTLQRWSSTFDWTRRSQAWDRHQAGIESEVRQRKDREKAELLAARWEEAQEQNFHLLNKVRQATHQLLDRPQIEKTVDRHGNTFVKHATSLTIVEPLVRSIISLEKHMLPPPAAGLQRSELAEQFIIDPLLPESGDVL